MKNINLCDKTAYHLQLWEKIYNPLPSISDDPSIAPLLQTRDVIGALIMGNIQNVPPIDLDDWEASWGALAHVDILTAIRIFAYLPTSLVREKPKDEKTKEGLAFISDFYHSAATRLLCWELTIELPDLPERWKPYEGFALLSESRYKFLRGLNEKEEIDRNVFPSVSFAWLMTEAAVCRQKLGHAGIIKIPYSVQEAQSKELIYTKSQEYWEKFSSPGNTLELVPVEDMEVFVTYLDRVFDVSGYNTASRDDNFHSYYYLPYWEARNKWFMQVRKDPALKIFSLKPPKKRRGTCIGKKRNNIQK